MNTTTPSSTPSTPVSADEVNASLDEIFMPDQPKPVKWERFKSLLMNIMNHGIDWRDGNPFKQIGKFIEANAERWEAAHEAAEKAEKQQKRGRKRSSKSCQRRRTSKSRYIKIE